MRRIESYKDTGIAAWKIAAGRTEVEHEQGVADKGRVADQVGEAVIRMPGRRDNTAIDVAKFECIAVIEQPIELVAIRDKRWFEVKNLPKPLLHLGYARTNTMPTAQLGLDVQC